MKILLVSAEVAPYAKAGGLADIAGTLPIEWESIGQSAIVMMPKYAGINVHKFGFTPTDIIISVPMSWWTEYARLWYGTLPNSNVPVYLIENTDYFNRNGIYGDPNEFWDNDRRFIFFSRAIFEASKALNYYPDIIHAHDFHTAFALAFLKSQYVNDPFFNRTAGVYTIHNLAYQGWFFPDRAMDFSTFGMSQFYPGSWFERNGMVNAMKTGIMFADKITTVSPTYANEIRDPYFSEGLQDVLNYRGKDLIGILNGVYYDEWSAEKDDFIFRKFDADSLHKKRDNKIEFLREHNVSEDDNPDMPLVGMVTRLAEQKGIDLIINKLEELLSQNKFRLALLGSGETRYQDYFHYIAWKYPGKAFIHIGYNSLMSHRILASSDFFLMPSRFEPCGLTQMYALKYGAIPIVRMTGGLADTVTEYNHTTGQGTGFLFKNYNADDFAFAIRRALDVYNYQPHWDIIRRNAMNSNFPSRTSAFEYLKVFRWALERIGVYL